MTSAESERRSPDTLAPAHDLRKHLASLVGPPTYRDAFNRAADRANAVLGSVWALILSVLVVVVWALTGPLFKFSDTWQLAINTGTTVVTFWMVFVIQNNQNRASKAVQLKLDEVIRALDGAENKFIRLEAASEAVLAEREAEMGVIADVAAGTGISAATAPLSEAQSSLS